MSPRASRASVRRARAPRSRPVSSATRMPAASASGAMVLEVLAREDFGRRHQRRLPAGLDHGRGMASSATTVLPEPTSPCSSRSMRSGLARSRDDLGDRAASATAVSAKGRAAIELRRAARPSPALARPARAAHVRAHERERELAGEQFVIGEPRPGRRSPAAASAGSAGRCSARSASANAGQRLRASQRRVLPFRQVRQRGRARASTALRTWLRRQPFGQRIDRLDQRQLREARFVDHAVGMHHLQHAVVELDRAGDVAPLADRQELLQVVLARVEEGQR